MRRFIPNPWWLAPISTLALLICAPTWSIMTVDQAILAMEADYRASADEIRIARPEEPPSDLWVFGGQPPPEWTRQSDRLAAR